MNVKMNGKTLSGWRRGCTPGLVLVLAAAGLGLVCAGAAQATDPSEIPDLQLWSSMGTESVLTPYLHEAYWQDVSGNAYDAMQNVAPYFGAGNRGTAIDFIGTTTRMTVHDGFDPRLDAGTTDFSVSFWYYQEEFATGAAFLLTNGNSANSGEGGFSFYTSDGALRLRMNDVAEATETKVSLYDPLYPDQDMSGTWHHVVGVFDRTGVHGPANTVSLYVDNSLLNSTVLPAVGGSSSNYNVIKAPGTTSSGKELVLGGRDTVTTSNFEGYMDDVAIYRGALSSTDVTALYNATTLTANTITTAGITPVAIHNFVNNLDRPETIGVVPDDHGGNHGAMKNFTQVTDATRGQVIEVNGLNNITESVDYGDVMDPMSTSYTAALWFKINDLSGDDQTLMSKGMNGSSGHEGWSVVWNIDGPDTGRIVVRANPGTTTATRLNVEKTLAISDDQWHHVALVIDQESGVIKGYLDGLGSGLAGTENGWTTFYGNAFGSFVDKEFNSAESLLLGYQNYSQNPLTGRLDDLAIWNRALTDAEILSLYGGTPPPRIPGDATGEGTVDELDAQRLAQNWGATGETIGWAQGDFNGDNKVDARDAAIMAANWGATTSEAAGVPEPSTLVLLLLGAVTVLATRPR